MFEKEMNVSNAMVDLNTDMYKYTILEMICMIYDMILKNDIKK